MKKSRILLSIVLAIVGIFSVLTFAGCDVSVDTLSKTIAEVNQKYTKYKDVFTSGKLISSSYETNYIVNYGDVVNGYVKSSESRYAEFKELENKYNVMLAASQKYIDDNSARILNYEKYNKFTSDAKKCLNDFNSKMNDFANSFEDFAASRVILVDYFKKYSGANAPSQEVEQDHLQIFKRSYGTFVSKCVKAAAALAKSIENTEIFEILKATEINESNIKILKEYVEIKAVEFLDNFCVDNILNKITWNVYKTKTSSKVVQVYNNVESFYKNKFLPIVVNDVPLNDALSKENYKNLFELSENYITESEYFVKATNDFDFYKWATEYECDENKYCEKENKLALIQLDKMNQFIKTTSNIYFNRFNSEIFSVEDDEE